MLRLRTLPIIVSMALCALVLLPSSTADAGRPGGKLVPAAGAYFGAYTNPEGVWQGNVYRQAQVQRREAQIARTYAVDHHYYAWWDVFPSGLEQWDLANGRVPLISWDGTRLADINSGKEDDLIRQRARGVKALGEPVFLRWCWEMNGDWMRCGGARNNPDGPAKYRQAWKRIVDIFRSEGATNAVWVWSPNAGDVPAQSWNHWTNYYPGDAYVDWVGIDGYNWTSTSFEAIFTPVYRDYAGRKPIMIAETSSSNGDPNRKAQWITAARDGIKARFPSVAAFVWFDEKKEADWRPDSSSSSFDAYKAMATDPHFSPMAGPL